MAEMSNALKSFLKKADKRWQEGAAAAKSESGERPEDGRYLCQLIEASFSETKSGKYMVVFNWKILEGELADTRFKDFRVLDLDGEWGFVNLAKLLRSLGYETDEIHTDPTRSKEDGFLLNVLDGITEDKPVARIRLATKAGSDFQNLYIEEVYDGYIGEGEEPEKTPAKPAPKTTKKADESVTVEEVEEVEEAVEEVEEVVEEEEVELAVGMKVSFLWKKEPMVGVVREILEDENKVKIKVDNKIYPVSADDISLIDGETD